MKEVYIYGAGNIGKDILHRIRDVCKVKGFIDSNSAIWDTVVDGVSVSGGPDTVPDLKYDEIIIAITTERDAVRETLIQKNVPIEKINTEYVNTYIESRLSFLRDFASINIDEAKGVSVAEGGVFRGDFAKAINTYFPHSKLFLFDTFEGFKTEDTDVEISKGYSTSKPGRFSDTSENLVVSKLPHPENVIIKKGYFPETTKGLENEKFFFVNLDFDLYQPTLEGLRFFYPRLSNKGVILIHDYFTQTFHGISQAIKDFEKELGYELVKLPIGDHCSIAIVKTDR